MTELLLELKNINDYLNFFRKCMTKNGNRHAIAYVNGLIFSFKKSIKKITRNHQEYTHHSKIQRLLNTLSVDFERLEALYLQKIRFFLKGKISLVFDDTNQERNGKKIDYAQNHHDHTSGGFIRGHQFFTAMLCTENVCFPLFPRLYHKGSMSKIDMAKEVIMQTSKKFQLENIMFDSWYSEKKLIKLASFKAKKVICGLKSGRLFSSKPLVWNDNRKIISDEKAKEFHIDENKYFIQSEVGRIKGSKGKLLISRQFTEEKMSKHFFIFCSCKKMSEVEIIRAYHIRWSIEVYHRDMKQHLGFHPFVRKQTAIVRHAIFTTLAYAALKMHMLYHNINQTIGECITTLRESNFSNFIKEIVEIENKSERLKAYQEVFINKIAQV